ncbi:uncharacterized protein ARB_00390 [Trichophyton benhamiae CBS 112371]|uniref:Uncharacterized protein n=1 Tax=Arthroderma benhamiae (strain ATCC MYA-4681 / CBS 112371) TaxID=663331 RepID=D4AW26_ARTBC|nr:uncharacterized protein ARB_00390 [Trichophyton benhamiae CBS 112371]EFE32566.1 conserved hypothetical protein [Trichophyton benhamiae CBS 112371]
MQQVLTQDGICLALEIYFARSCGIGQVSLALIFLVLTGALPLASSYSITADESDPKKEYAFPMLLISSGFHAVVAGYTYSWYSGTGQMGFAAGMLASGFLAAMGLWCMLFAGSSRISKRTGADKRTSGFPFKNVEADKRKKR